jgi:hypothetical protein
MELISVSFLLFSAFGFVGWKYSGKLIWNFVDVLYYPVVAIGVIVFFFQSVVLREIAITQALEEQQEDRLTQIGEARPDATAMLTNPDHIQFGARVLRVILQDNDACQRLGMTQAYCFVAEDIAPIVQNAERTLATYTGLEDLHAVCTSATKVFQDLEDDEGLSTFLMRSLAEHYRDGLQQGFLDNEYERVIAYLNGLRPTLEDSAADIAPELELDEDQIAYLTARYSAQINYGIWIAKAFEACLRAPETIRSGAYAAWNTEYTGAADQVAATREAIRDLNVAATQVNHAGRFRLLYWPYFLMLALALKFGKGVSTLRKNGA